MCRKVQREKVCFFKVHPSKSFNCCACGLAAIAFLVIFIFPTTFVCVRFFKDRILILRLCVCVQDCGGAPLCYLTESHTQVGAQSTQIWLHKKAANRTNFDEKSLEDILTWDQWWTCIPVRPTPSTALYMLGLVGLAARPASLALCANWSKQTAQGAMDPKLPRRSAMKVRALISETIGLPEIDKAATKMTLTGPTTCSLNPSRRNYLLAFNCLAVFSYLNLKFKLTFQRQYSEEWALCTQILSGQKAQSGMPPCSAPMTQAAAKVKLYHDLLPGKNLKFLNGGLSNKNHTLQQTHLPEHSQRPWFQSRGCRMPTGAK